MPPKSKSNLGKSKMVPKPKQQRRVKNPTRNWLELPSDLMLNILQRLGVGDILQNAQKVCPAWGEICKDPSMWRVVCIDNTFWDPFDICKVAVNRSRGQLLDLSLINVCDDELLQYVANRSSQLRRLEIMRYFGTHEIWSEAFKKLSLLEELSLVRTNILQEDIEALSRYCPLLKALKLNHKAEYVQNEIAFAIGKNLPDVTHLELIRSGITNKGLLAILDGCCHLESLDLRGSLHVSPYGSLGERCSKQIKYLKLPNESLKGCPHAYDRFEDEYLDDDVMNGGFHDFDDYYDYYITTVRN